MALTVRQKAGVDGRLFGSVTNIDIVDALIAQGHEVERAMVRLPQGPLKMIGEYDISVALHSDVVVQIKVTVQGESAQ
jgi:large subunit ribosomal protein L9